jgi:hypothetical protein
MSGCSAESTDEPLAPSIVEFQNEITLDYVRQVVLPRIERTDDGQYKFPDVLTDLHYWSREHSWYKHFRPEPGFCYPLLRIGHEPKGIINLHDPKTPIGDELHWTFVERCSVFDSISGFDQDAIPFELVRDFPILFSYQIAHYAPGSSDEFDLQEHHEKCALMQCENVRRRFVRALLAVDPNPPPNQVVHFDPQWDFDGACETKIAGRTYLLIF